MGAVLFTYARLREGRGDRSGRPACTGRGALVAEVDDKVDHVVERPVVFALLADRVAAYLDAGDAGDGELVYPAAALKDRVPLLDLSEFAAFGVGHPDCLRRGESAVYTVIADAHRALFAGGIDRIIDRLADGIFDSVVDAHEHVARASVGAVIVPIGCDRLAVHEAGERRRRRGRDRGRAVVGLDDRTGVESERRGRDRERGLRIGGGGHSDRGA